MLNITIKRAGFAELDGWMVKQGAPIDVVVMESSGHYLFNLASHLRRQGYPVAVVNPLQAKYFAKSRHAAEQERPGRRAHTRGVGNARPAADQRALGGGRAQGGGMVCDAPGAGAGSGLPAHPAVGGHRLS